MRDGGALKDAPRARRGVVGALLLVFVVVAAAALLVPVASDGRPNHDASTSAGVTLAEGAAAWARATGASSALPTFPTTGVVATRGAVSTPGGAARRPGLGPVRRPSPHVSPLRVGRERARLLAANMEITRGYI